MLIVGKPGITGTNITSIGLGVSVGGGGGEAIKPEFLLRLDFGQDMAGPLVGTYGEGQGEATLVDSSESRFSISNGELVCSGGNGSYGDASIFSSALVRAAGQAMFLIGLTFTGGTAHMAGWGHAVGTTLNDGAVWSAGGGYRMGGTTSNVSGTDGPNDVFVVVNRARGTLPLLRQGGVWTLMYVDNVTTRPNPVAGLANFNRSYRLDSFRVAQLGGPWLLEHDLATTILSGAQLAGQVFEHEADGLITWIQTTLPSTDYTDMYLRIVDANNAIVASVASDGTLELYEVAGGVWSLLGSSPAAAVSNGSRVMVRLRGSTILVDAGTSTVVNATGVSITAAKNGKLDALGTDGAVSDIVVRPYVIDGIAKQWLDAAIAN